MATDYLQSLFDQVESQGINSDYLLDYSLQSLRPKELRVIDNDTVENIITGDKFRFTDFDAPETIAGTDKAKAVGLSTPDEYGSSTLQEMINSGQITAESLYQNAVGKDDYGRYLTTNNALTDAMIARGEAVPTNRYDFKRQELYRAYQQKQYDLYGEVDSELADLRDYSLDNSYSPSIAYRAGNLADALQSNSARVLSEFGDLVLDIGKYGIAKAINPILSDKNKLDTNSDLFDEWKTREFQDREWGYDSSESQFKINEAAHQFLTGDYGGAVTYALLNSPELIVESLPDMLEMMIPMSSVTKANKVIQAVSNLVRRNAGLATWAAQTTNTDIDARKKNNVDEYVSFGEALGMYTQKVLLGALDRATFFEVMRTPDGVKNIVKAMNNVEGGLLKRMTVKSLYGLGAVANQIAVKGSTEALQEGLQSYGDILAVKYGTDKFGYNLPKDPDDIKQVVTEALAGFGAGGGMGVSGVAVNAGVQAAFGSKDTSSSKADNTPTDSQPSPSSADNTTQSPSDTDATGINKQTIIDNIEKVKSSDDLDTLMKTYKDDIAKLTPDEQQEIIDTFIKAKDKVDKDTSSSSTLASRVDEAKQNAVNTAASSISDRIKNIAKEYNRDIGDKDPKAPENQLLHKSFIDRFKKIGNELKSDIGASKAYETAKEVADILVANGIEEGTLTDDNIPKELAGISKESILAMTNIYMSANSSMEYLLELGEALDEDLLKQAEQHLGSLNDVDLYKTLSNAKNLSKIKDNTQDDRILSMIKKIDEYHDEYEKQGKVYGKLGKKTLKDIWYGSDNKTGIVEHEIMLTQDKNLNQENLKDTKYHDFMQSRVDKYQAFKKAVDEAVATGKPVVATGNTRHRSGTWGTIDNDGVLTYDKPLTATPKGSFNLLNTLKLESELVSKRYKEFKSQLPTTKKTTTTTTTTESNTKSEPTVEEDTSTPFDEEFTVNEDEYKTPPPPSNKTVADANIVKDTTLTNEQVANKVLTELAKAKTIDEVNKVFNDNKASIKNLDKKIATKLYRYIHRKQQRLKPNKAPRKPSKAETLDKQYKTLTKLIKLYMDDIKLLKKANAKDINAVYQLQKKLNKLFKKREKLLKDLKKKKDELKSLKNKRDSTYAKIKKNKNALERSINAVASVIIAGLKMLYKTLRGIMAKIKVTKSDIAVTRAEIALLNEEIKPILDLINRLKGSIEERKIDIISDTKKVKKIQKNRETILNEYKARIRKSQLFTDKAIDSIRTVNKDFYLKVKAIAGRLPKGYKLKRLGDIDKATLLLKNFNQLKGSDFSNNTDEALYFDKVIKGFSSVVDALIDSLKTPKDLDNMSKRKSSKDREEILEYNQFFNAVKNNNIVRNLILFNIINSYVIEYGNLSSLNTNRDIALMLGLDSEYDVTVEMIKQLSTRGALQTNVINGMVGNINDYLSMVSDTSFGDKLLNTTIATMSLLAMVQSGVFEKNSMNKKDFMGLADKAVATEESEVAINFIKALPHNNTLFKSIFDDGRTLLKKLFNIQSTKYQTTPHKLSKDETYKGSDVLLSDKAREAIEKQQSTGRQVRKDIVELYNQLGDAKFKRFMRYILGYDKRPIENIHISQRPSIKGKNLQIEKAIDDLVEVITKHGTEKLYFRYVAKSETRTHLVSPSFQPQSNKLHRFTSHSEYSTREVDVNNPKQFFIWKSSILDGLGIETAKMDNLDDVNIGFEKIITDTAISKFINDKELDDVLLNDLVLRYGEEAHTLQALLELRNYIQNSKDGKFNTSLEKETDAKTSGNTLQSIFYFNPFSNESVELVHRGGILTTETDATDNYEYTEPDTYEATAIEQKDRAIDYSDFDFEYQENQIKHAENDKEYNFRVNYIMQYNLFKNVFLPLFGSWITNPDLKNSKELKDGRKFNKQPITAVGYGAGRKSVTNGKFSEFLDSFYTMLEEVANMHEVETDKVQRLLHAVNGLLSLTKGIKKQYPIKGTKGKFIPLQNNELKHIRDILMNILINPDKVVREDVIKLFNNFTFSSYDTNTLQRTFSDGIGKVILNPSIEKVLAPIQDGVKLFTEITNVHNDLFLNRYFKELDTIFEDKGYIEESDLLDVTKELQNKGIMPSFTNMEGVSIPLYKKGFNEAINRYLEDKNYQVKIAVTPPNNKNITTFTKQTIKVRTFVDLGVKAPAVTTLATDSAILNNTASKIDKDKVGMLIFDAILSAEGAAKEYNSSMNDLIDSTHIPIVDAINKLRAIIPKFDADTYRDVLNTRYDKEGVDEIMQQLIYYYEDIKNNKYRDDILLNMLITHHAGEVFTFDSTPISFIKELFLLNRKSLQNMTTHIDHSVGINDKHTRDNPTRIDIKAYKRLIDKYRSYIDEDTSDYYNTFKRSVKNSKYGKGLNKTTTKAILEFGLKSAKEEDVIKEFGEVTKWLMDDKNKSFVENNTAKTILDKYSVKYLNKTKLLSLINNYKNVRFSLNGFSTDFSNVRDFTITKENLSDIFDLVDSMDNNKHSDEHTQMMRNLLRRTISPVIEEINASIGTTTEKLSKGLSEGSKGIKIALSNKGNHLNFSGTELYLHEMLHNVMDKVLSDSEMNVFVSMIRDMMYTVKQSGKGHELFLDPNKTYDADDIATAKRMYNYIFKGGGNVEEFISYGLTNPNFMKNLSKFSIESKDSNKRTLLGKLIDVFKSIFDKLKMLITTGKVDNNYQKQLNTLVDRALGISIAEHNKALMKLYTVAKGISDKADRKAIKPVLKELNKFTRQFSRSLQNYYKNNSSKIIKDILLMYPTGYSKDRSQFFNDLLNLDKRAIMIYSMVTALNKLPVYKNLTGFALHNMLLSEARRLRGFLAKSDLGNELNIIYDTITKGAEDTEFAGKYLRESIKVIDDAREHTRALVYGKVKELTNILKLDKYDSNNIYNIFVRGQLYNLLNSMSISRIVELLGSKDKVRNAIKVRENIFTDKQLKMIKQLASYSLTGLSATKHRNMLSLAVNFKFLDNIDTARELIALYAIKESNEDISISDNESLNNLLLYQKNISGEYTFDLYGKNQINSIDGETYENNSNVKRIKYVLVSNTKEKKNLKDLGIKPIKAIPNPFDSEVDILVYPVDNMEAGYTRGAMVYGNKNKGRTLYNLHYELYGERIEEHNFKKALQASRVNSKYYYPIYKDNFITNYEVRALDYLEEQKYLKYETELAKVMANTKARTGEQAIAETMNRKVVDAIVLNYSNAKNTKDWIEVSKKSEEYLYIWNMLPNDTKRYITKKYGGKLFLPRAGRTRHIFLGDEDATISNIVPKKIKGFTKYIESFWQELMGLWKIEVVIKIPSTLLTNMTSNIIQTVNMGYSPTKVMAYQKEGYQALQAYIADANEIRAIEFDRDSGIPYDEYRLGELKYRVATNKIKLLVDEGLLSSLFEDINGTEIFKNISPLKDKLDNIASIVPENIINMSNELYLTDKTEYYKFMYRMTQASDFVARYAMMKLMQEDTKHKYNDKEILETILDSFIQYDIPDGRYVRWFDSVSVIPFQKYYLRIQKVLYKLFYKHTASTIGIQTAQNMFMDLEDPFDSAWYNKNPLSKVVNPFDNVEELLTPVSLMAII